MPVEIRELVIKTEIRSKPVQAEAQLDKEQLKQLKQQIVGECKQMLKNQFNKNSFNR